MPKKRDESGGIESQKKGRKAIRVEGDAKKKKFEGLNSKIKRKVIRAEGNTKKKGGEGEGSKAKKKKED